MGAGRFMSRPVTQEAGERRVLTFEADGGQKTLTRQGKGRFQGRLMGKVDTATAVHSSFATTTFNNSVLTYSTNSLSTKNIYEENKTPSPSSNMKNQNPDSLTVTNISSHKNLIASTNDVPEQTTKKETDTENGKKGEVTWSSKKESSSRETLKIPSMDTETSTSPTTRMFSSTIALKTSKGSLTTTTPVLSVSGRITNEEKEINSESRAENENTREIISSISQRTSKSANLLTPVATITSAESTQQETTFYSTITIPEERARSSIGTTVQVTKSMAMSTTPEDYASSITISGMRLSESPFTNVKPTLETSSSTATMALQEITSNAPKESANVSHDIQSHSVNNNLEEKETTSNIISSGKAESTHTVISTTPLAASELTSIAQTTHKITISSAESTHPEIMFSASKTNPGENTSSSHGSRSDVTTSMAISTTPQHHGSSQATSRNKVSESPTTKESLVTKVEPTLETSSSTATITLQGMTSTVPKESVKQTQDIQSYSTNNNLEETETISVITISAKNTTNVISVSGRVTNMERTDDKAYATTHENHGTVDSETDRHRTATSRVRFTRPELSTRLSAIASTIQTPQEHTSSSFSTRPEMTATTSVNSQSQEIPRTVANPPTVFKTHSASEGLGSSSSASSLMSQLTSASALSTEKEINTMSTTENENAQEITSSKSFGRTTTSAESTQQETTLSSTIAKLEESTSSSIGTTLHVMKSMEISTTPRYVISSKTASVNEFSKSPITNVKQTLETSSSTATTTLHEMTSTVLTESAKIIQDIQSYSTTSNLDDKDSSSIIAMSTGETESNHAIINATPLATSELTSIAETTHKITISSAESTPPETMFSAFKTSPGENTNSSRNLRSDVTTSMAISTAPQQHGISQATSRSKASESPTTEAAFSTETFTISAQENTSNVRFEPPRYTTQQAVKSVPSTNTIEANKITSSISTQETTSGETLKTQPMEKTSAITTTTTTSKGTETSTLPKTRTLSSATTLMKTYTSPLITIRERETISEISTESPKTATKVISVSGGITNQQRTYDKTYTTTLESHSTVAYSETDKHRRSTSRVSFTTPGMSTHLSAIVSTIRTPHENATSSVSTRPERSATTSGHSKSQEIPMTMVKSPTVSEIHSTSQNIGSSASAFSFVTQHTSATILPTEKEVNTVSTAGNETPEQVASSTSLRTSMPATFADTTHVSTMTTAESTQQKTTFSSTLTRLEDSTSSSIATSVDVTKSMAISTVPKGVTSSTTTSGMGLSESLVTKVEPTLETSSSTATITLQGMTSTVPKESMKQTQDIQSYSTNNNLEETETISIITRSPNTATNVISVSGRVTHMERTDDKAYATTYENHGTVDFSETTSKGTETSSLPKTRTLSSATTLLKTYTSPLITIRERETISEIITESPKTATKVISVSGGITNQQRTYDKTYTTTLESHSTIAYAETDKHRRTTSRESFTTPEMSTHLSAIISTIRIPHENANSSVSTRPERSATTSGHSKSQEIPMTMVNSPTVSEIHSTSQNIGSSASAFSFVTQHTSASVLPTEKEVNTVSTAGNETPEQVTSSTSLRTSMPAIFADTTHVSTMTTAESTQQKTTFSSTLTRLEDSTSSSIATSVDVTKSMAISTVPKGVTSSTTTSGMGLSESLVTKVEPTLETSSSTATITLKGMTSTVPKESMKQTQDIQSYSTNNNLEETETISIITRSPNTATNVISVSGRDTHMEITDDKAYATTHENHGTVDYSETMSKGTETSSLPKTRTLSSATTLLKTYTSPLITIRERETISEISTESPKTATNVISVSGGITNQQRTYDKTYTTTLESHSTVAYSETDKHRRTTSRVNFTTPEMSTHLSAIISTIITPHENATSSVSTRPERSATTSGHSKSQVPMTMVNSPTVSEIHSTSQNIGSSASAFSFVTQHTSSTVLPTDKEVNTVSTAGNETTEQVTSSTSLRTSMPATFADTTHVSTMTTAESTQQKTTFSSTLTRLEDSTSSSIATSVDVTKSMTISTVPKGVTSSTTTSGMALSESLITKVEPSMEKSSSTATITRQGMTSTVPKESMKQTQDIQSYSTNNHLEETETISIITRSPNTATNVISVSGRDTHMEITDDKAYATTHENHGTVDYSETMSKGTETSSLPKTRTLSSATTLLKTYTSPLITIRERETISEISTESPKTATNVISVSGGITNQQRTYDKTYTTTLESHSTVAYSETDKHRRTTSSVSFTTPEMSTHLSAIISTIITPHENATSSVSTRPERSATTSGHSKSQVPMTMVNSPTVSEIHSTSQNIGSSASAFSFVTQHTSSTVLPTDKEVNTVSTAGNETTEQVTSSTSLRTSMPATFADTTHVSTMTTAESTQQKTTFSSTLTRLEDSTSSSIATSVDVTKSMTISTVPKGVTSSTTTSGMALSESLITKVEPSMEKSSSTATITRQGMTSTVPKESMKQTQDIQSYSTNNHLEETETISIITRSPNTATNVISVSGRVTNMERTDDKAYATSRENHGTVDYSETTSKGTKTSSLPKTRTLSSATTLLETYTSPLISIRERETISEISTESPKTTTNVTSVSGEITNQQKTYDKTYTTTLESHSTVAYSETDKHRKTTSSVSFTTPEMSTHLSAIVSTIRTPHENATYSVSTRPERSATTSGHSKSQEIPMTMVNSPTVSEIHSTSQNIGSSASAFSFVTQHTSSTVLPTEKEVNTVSTAGNETPKQVASSTSLRTSMPATFADTTHVSTMTTAESTQQKTTFSSTLTRLEDSTSSSIATSVDVTKSMAISTVPKGVTRSTTTSGMGLSESLVTKVEPTLETSSSTATITLQGMTSTVPKESMKQTQDIQSYSTNNNLEETETISIITRSPNTATNVISVSGRDTHMERTDDKAYATTHENHGTVDYSETMSKGTETSSLPKTRTLSSATTLLKTYTSPLITIRERETISEISTESPKTATKVISVSGGITNQQRTYDKTYTTTLESHSTVAYAETDKHRRTTSRVSFTTPEMSTHLSAILSTIRTPHENATSSVSTRPERSATTSGHSKSQEIPMTMVNSPTVSEIHSTSQNIGSSASAFSFVTQHTSASVLPTEKEVNTVSTAGNETPEQVTSSTSLRTSMPAIFADTTHVSTMTTAESTQQKTTFSSTLTRLEDSTSSFIATSVDVTKSMAISTVPKGVTSSTTTSGMGLSESLVTKVEPTLETSSSTATITLKGMTSTVPKESMKQTQDIQSYSTNNNLEETETISIITRSPNTATNVISVPGRDTHMEITDDKAYATTHENHGTVDYSETMSKGTETSSLPKTRTLSSATTLLKTYTSPLITIRERETISEISTESPKTATNVISVSGGITNQQRTYDKTYTTTLESHSTVAYSETDEHRRTTSRVNFTTPEMSTHLSAIISTIITPHENATSSVSTRPERSATTSGHSKSQEIPMTMVNSPTVSEIHSTSQNIGSSASAFSFLTQHTSSTVLPSEKEVNTVSTAGNETPEQVASSTSLRTSMPATFADTTHVSTMTTAESTQQKTTFSSTLTRLEDSTSSSIATSVDVTKSMAISTVPKGVTRSTTTSGMGLSESLVTKVEPTMETSSSTATITLQGMTSTVPKESMKQTQDIQSYSTNNNLEETETISIITRSPNTATNGISVSGRDTHMERTDDKAYATTHENHGTVDYSETMSKGTETSSLPKTRTLSSATTLLKTYTSPLITIRERETISEISTESPKTATKVISVSGGITNQQRTYDKTYTTTLESHSTVAYAETDKHRRTTSRVSFTTPEMSTHLSAILSTIRTPHENATSSVSTRPERSATTSGHSKSQEIPMTMVNSPTVSEIHSTSQNIGSSASAFSFVTQHTSSTVLPTEKEVNTVSTAGNETPEQVTSSTSLRTSMPATFADTTHVSTMTTAESTQQKTTFSSTLTRLEDSTSSSIATSVDVTKSMAISTVPKGVTRSTTTSGMGLSESLVTKVEPTMETSSSTATITLQGMTSTVPKESMKQTQDIQSYSTNNNLEETETISIITRSPNTATNGISVSGRDTHMEITDDKAYATTHENHGTVDYSETMSKGTETSSLPKTRTLSSATTLLKTYTSPLITIRERETISEISTESPKTATKVISVSGGITNQQRTYDKTYTTTLESHSTVAYAETDKHRRTTSRVSFTTPEMSTHLSAIISTIRTPHENATSSVSTRPERSVTTSGHSKSQEIPMTMVNSPTVSEIHSTSQNIGSSASAFSFVTQHTSASVLPTEKEVNTVSTAGNETPEQVTSSTSLRTSMPATFADTTHVSTMTTAESTQQKTTFSSTLTRLEDSISSSIATSVDVTKSMAISTVPKGVTSSTTTSGMGLSESLITKVEPTMETSSSTATITRQGMTSTVPKESMKQTQDIQSYSTNNHLEETETISIITRSPNTATNVISVSGRVTHMERTDDKAYATTHENHGTVDYSETMSKGTETSSLPKTRTLSSATTLLKTYTSPLITIRERETISEISTESPKTATKVISISGGITNQQRTYDKTYTTTLENHSTVACAETDKHRRTTSRVSFTTPEMSTHLSTIISTIRTPHENATSSVSTRPERSATTSGHSKSQEIPMTMVNSPTVSEIHSTSENIGSSASAFSFVTQHTSSTVLPTEKEVNTVSTAGNETPEQVASSTSLRTSMPATFADTTHVSTMTTAESTQQKTTFSSTLTRLEDSTSSSIATSVDVTKSMTISTVPKGVTSSTTTSGMGLSESLITKVEPTMETSSLTATITRQGMTSTVPKESMKQTQDIQSYSTNNNLEETETISIITRSPNTATNVISVSGRVTHMERTDDKAYATTHKNHGTVDYSETMSKGTETSSLPKTRTLSSATTLLKTYTSPLITIRETETISEISTESPKTARNVISVSGEITNQQRTYDKTYTTTLESHSTVAYSETDKHRRTTSRVSFTTPEMSTHLSAIISTIRTPHENATSSVSTRPERSATTSGHSKSQEIPMTMVNSPTVSEIHSTSENIGSSASAFSFVTQHTSSTVLPTKKEVNTVSTAGNETPEQVASSTSLRTSMPATFADTTHVSTMTTAESTQQKTTFSSTLTRLEDSTSSSIATSVDVTKSMTISTVPKGITSSTTTSGMGLSESLITKVEPTMETSSSTATITRQGMTSTVPKESMKQTQDIQSYSTNNNLEETETISIITRSPNTATNVISVSGRDTHMEITDDKAYATTHENHGTVDYSETTSKGTETSSLPKTRTLSSATTLLKTYTSPLITIRERETISEISTESPKTATNVISVSGEITNQQRTYDKTYTTTLASHSTVAYSETDKHRRTTSRVSFTIPEMSTHLSAIISTIHTPHENATSSVSTRPERSATTSGHSKSQEIPMTMVNSPSVSEIHSTSQNIGSSASAFSFVTQHTSSTVLPTDKEVNTVSTAGNETPEQVTSSTSLRTSMPATFADTTHVSKMTTAESTQQKTTFSSTLTRLEDSTSSSIATSVDVTKSMAISTVPKGVKSSTTTSGMGLSESLVTKVEPTMETSSSTATITLQGMTSTVPKESMKQTQDIQSYSTNNNLEETENISIITRSPNTATNVISVSGRVTHMERTDDKAYATTHENHGTVDYSETMFKGTETSSLPKTSSVSTRPERSATTSGHSKSQEIPMTMVNSPTVSEIHSTSQNIGSSASAFSFVTQYTSASVLPTEKEVNTVSTAGNETPEQVTSSTSLRTSMLATSADTTPISSMTTAGSIQDRTSSSTLTRLIDSRSSSIGTSVDMTKTMEISTVPIGVTSSTITRGMGLSDRFVTKVEPTLETREKTETIPSASAFSLMTQHSASALPSTAENETTQEVTSSTSLRNSRSTSFADTTPVATVTSAESRQQETTFSSTISRQEERTSSSITTTIDVTKSMAKATTPTERTSSTTTSGMGLSETIVSKEKPTLETRSSTATITLQELTPNVPIDSAKLTQDRQSFSNNNNLEETKTTSTITMRMGETEKITSSTSLATSSTAEATHKITILSAESTPPETMLSASKTGPGENTSSSVTTSLAISSTPQKHGSSQATSRSKVSESPTTETASLTETPTISAQEITSNVLTAKDIESLQNSNTLETNEITSYISTQETTSGKSLKTQPMGKNSTITTTTTTSKGTETSTLPKTRTLSSATTILKTSKSPLITIRERETVSEISPVSPKTATNLISVSGSITNKQRTDDKTYTTTLESHGTVDYSETDRHRRTTSRVSFTTPEMSTHISAITSSIRTPHDHATSSRTESTTSTLVVYSPVEKTSTSTTTRYSTRSDVMINMANSTTAREHRRSEVTSGTKAFQSPIKDVKLINETTTRSAQDITSEIFTETAGQTSSQDMQNFTATNLLEGNKNTLGFSTKGAQTSETNKTSPSIQTSSAISRSPLSTIQKGSTEDQTTETTVPSTNEAAHTSETATVPLSKTSETTLPITNETTQASTTTENTVPSTTTILSTSEKTVPSTETTVPSTTTESTTSETTTVPSSTTSETTLPSSTETTPAPINTETIAPSTTTVSTTSETTLHSSTETTPAPTTTETTGPSTTTESTTSETTVPLSTTAETILPSSTDTTPVTTTTETIAHSTTTESTTSETTLPSSTKTTPTPITTETTVPSTTTESITSETTVPLSTTSETTLPSSIETTPAPTTTETIGPSTTTQPTTSETTVPLSTTAETTLPSSTEITPVTTTTETIAPSTTRESTTSETTVRSSTTAETTLPSSTETTPVTTTTETIAPSTTTESTVPSSTETIPYNCRKNITFNRNNSSTNSYRDHRSLNNHRVYNFRNNRSFEYNCRNKITLIN
ncbi:serine-rich adhesin for platelets-like [Xenopus laevis]|uniref:Serine-rich adhesin for platelets-like n=1 Tax=Xenopus laevis TaxID=8355 RepID=A0A8J1MFZ9_XENLA|nr:serine-rich adhesin for platelets-like [Xenopus laevis]